MTLQMKENPKLLQPSLEMPSFFGSFVKFSQDKTILSSFYGILRKPDLKLV
jgi:hypothetical protein